jgi:hypothetical protein
MAIGNKYLETRDYPNAGYYFDMANNLQPGDPDVIAQKKYINDVAMEVTNLLAKGDEACITANIDYDRCIRTKDRTYAEQCILAYQEILKIFEQASVLSNSDMNIKHKISSLNKRIHNLNNL